MPAPRLFIAQSLTAVAPVAAIPTTAAHFVIWNGGAKTCVVTSLGFTTTTSAAAAFVAQLLALVTPAGQPVIAGVAAKGPLPTDGGANDSKVNAYSAVTLTAGQVGSGIWHPVGLGTNSAAQTATIALGSWAYVRGLYVLPPGGLLALATLGNTAAGASQLFATWEEA